MQIVLFGDDLTCIYMIQKIKICLLTSLIIVGAVSVMAQSVTTGKPVYDYGDRTEVFYNNAFTNSDFYFYHNAALVPSSFFVERVTFDNGDFVTDVLEPGKYTVKNIFEGTEYAQSSFRIADIPLQDNDLRILVVADAHVMAQALVVGESEAYQNAHRLRKGKPRIESTCPRYGVHYRPGCLLTVSYLVKLILKSF